MAHARLVGRLAKAVLEVTSAAILMKKRSSSARHGMDALRLIATDIEMIAKCDLQLTCGQLWVAA